jgi:hypothetical protein
MCILWFMFCWAPFSSTLRYCLFRSLLSLVTSYIYRKMPDSFLRLNFSIWPCEWPLILHCCLRIQRWLYPYDYQVVQEIHRDEPHEYSRVQLPETSHLSPEEQRSYAISMLPRENSKHTGFAFDSPGYESFFASQQGVGVPHKPWDVARRANTKQGRQ